ncbi:MAG: tetratricopeptide repeat-containing sulfotransferase family protein, partial [Chakrabartia godavariana]
MATAVPQPDFSRQLRNPRLLEAAVALNENRLHDAEPLLRQHLKADPFDVAAIRMMAELAGRIGRMKDAEALLRRAVELAPNFIPARSNLALVLYRQNRVAEAIDELEILAAVDPENLSSANLKAAALGRIGDYEEALQLYEMVLSRADNHPRIWLSYGHVLKTVGRSADSINAYRRAIGLSSHFGEAWWSLANMKSVKFDDDDLSQMKDALAVTDVTEADRLHLHFALGKGFEDRADAKASFDHYQTANLIRHAQMGYESNATSQLVAAMKRVFSPDFFATRQGWGCPDEDPIFVVGLPRAGSTLIEQILSSHSLVEGTMELPDMPALAASLGPTDKWEAQLASLDRVAIREMGAAYLERTRIVRKTDRPYFIDKLPNNWAYVGLIHLILPNAKIIDARRHPMACCFSNFKQHFARGQGFTYSLTDIGRYYADYVDFMAHIDRVLPGRVVRMFHEDMVEDSTREIRRLLDALGLPFEESCLRFWENDRAVRTASSEQVRRPIFKDGTEQWLMFEPYLDELNAALGPVLT